MTDILHRLMSSAMDRLPSCLMLTVLILMLYVQYFIFLILWLLQYQTVIFVFEGLVFFFLLNFIKCEYLFKEPKKRNKFKLLDSGCELTTQMIIERIISHRYWIADFEILTQAHFTAQIETLKTDFSNKLLFVENCYNTEILFFLSIQHLVSMDQYQCKDATHESL